MQGSRTNWYRKVGCVRGPRCVRIMQGTGVHAVATAMEGVLTAPFAVEDAGSRVAERTFSAIQAGFWMSFCVSTSFAVVYLQALGYSNGALGLILALGNLMGVAVSLGLSSWIDREPAITAARLLPKVMALQAASVVALLASPAEGAVTSVAFVTYIGFCTVVNALNLKLYADADHVGHLSVTATLGIALAVGVVGAVVTFVGTRSGGAGAAGAAAAD